MNVVKGLFSLSGIFQLLLFNFIAKRFVYEFPQKIFASFFIHVGVSMLRAQKDTVLYQRDSVIEVENSTAQFFQRSEKTTIPNKILLITKAGKTMAMTGFFKTLTVVDGTFSPTSVDYGFADLDNDGKKELLVSNFTGGAHCCDEIYIFKNIGVNNTN